MEESRRRNLNDVLYTYYIVYLTLMKKMPIFGVKHSTSGFMIIAETTHAHHRIASRYVLYTRGMEQ